MRFVVLVIALAAGTARADVGVVVTGEPVMQAPVLSQFQSWLQDHKYALIATPLGAMTNMFVDCFVIEDMSCARGVFEKESKSTSLVFVHVEPVTAQGERAYALTAHWFVKGHESIMGSQQCLACDDAALGAAVDAMMRELTRSSGLGTGHLKVSAAPVGTSIVLDDESLGAGPVDRDLSPGPHELKFLRDGVVIETRPIVVSTGQTIQIESPETRVAGDTHGGHSHVLPKLLVAGGAAIAVTGGVFLYYGSKGGPDEPYVYTNATPLGAVLTLAGAGAVVAGGILWFRDSRRTTPTVSLRPGGVNLGWAGTF